MCYSNRNSVALRMASVEFRLLCAQSQTPNAKPEPSEKNETVGSVEENALREVRDEG